MDGDDENERWKIEKEIRDLKRDKHKCDENLKRIAERARRSSPERDVANNSSKKDDDWKSRRAKRSRNRSEKSSTEKIRKVEAKEDNEEKKEGQDQDPTSKKPEDDEKDSKEKRDGDERKDSDEKEENTPDDKKDPAKEKRLGKMDARDRKLFGNLLGHLQQARTRLETEKGCKSTELNKKAEERMESKLCSQKLTLQDVRRQSLEVERKEEQAKMAWIEKELEKKELLLLQNKLSHHYSLMMNFIGTKAEPTIFYLPAKHSSQTEAALEETRALVRQKIKSLKEPFQPLSDESHQAQLAKCEAERQDRAARAAAAAAACAAACGDDDSIRKSDDSEL